MEESPQKKIATGVTIVVISALILSLVPAVLRLVKFVWNEVATFVVGVCSWLASAKFETHLWLFCVLLIATGILALIIVGYVRCESNKFSGWRDYVAGKFFDVNWRWNYSRNGTITNLWCYCPHDNTVLTTKEDFTIRRPSSSPLSDSGISLNCGTCAKKFGPFPDDKVSLCTKVKTQIDQNLRSKKWIKIVRPAEIVLSE
jgi:hypothetical protein